MSRSYYDYLKSLPRERLCMCGRALFGMCRVCSLPPEQKELPIEPDRQLSFGFVASETSGTSNIYTQE